METVDQWHNSRAGLQPRSTPKNTRCRWPEVYISCRDADVAQYTTTESRAASVFQPKELELIMLAGEPVHMATDRKGATIPVSGGPKSELDPQKIIAIGNDAEGPNLVELRLMGVITPTALA
jgi:hypothetical protein